MKHFSFSFLFTIKVSFVFLLLTFFTKKNSFAQNNDFQAGWHILKSGVKHASIDKDTLTKILKSVSAHWSKYDEISGSSTVYAWTSPAFKYTSRSLHSEEVVIAYMVTKEGFVYCIDTYGLILLIQDKQSLEKINTLGKPARVNKEVKISLDASLKEGNTVWLVDINPATKTATIL